MTPAMTFSLPGRHIFDAVTRAGWSCGVCGGVWPSLESALAVPCEPRRAA